MEERIKSIVKEFFVRLTVSLDDVTVLEDRGGFLVNISTKEEYVLLGRDSERFDSFSGILKKIIGKEVGEEVKISLDINGQKARRDAAISSKAHIIAERARSFKMDVEMEPMSSYERMVVHTVLEGAKDVETGSVGEGRERRVVVKYRPNTTEESLLL